MGCESPTQLVKFDVLGRARPIGRIHFAIPSERSSGGKERRGSKRYKKSTNVCGCGDLGNF
ncbi:heparinase [Sesbania bispinosa]|nr:heparinase [Sesbania bispinosa]